MKRNLLIFITAVLAISPSVAGSAGNTRIQSFNDAKKILEREVVYDQRITIYCRARFDKHKNIELPAGFTLPAGATLPSQFSNTNLVSRAQRMEWEHVVPAENFGRYFSEWREGHADCVDGKGKPFKGRSCAGKTNQRYRYMEADMYNLFPSIGAVNALRMNYNFTQLNKNYPATFGSCPMKIYGKQVEPPDYARGVIARAYLYMEYAYPEIRLSSSQKKIMEIWNNTYPVQKWECTRSKRIEKLQGNENPFVKQACVAKGWY